MTAPELVITDPDPEATVATKAYTFRGVTEPDATVIAAGRYGVEVDPDGGWSILLVLNPGWNRATFTATDPAGNTSVAMVRVEYVVPLEEAIVGWWKGPATVPVAWSKIGTVLFEFRADGTYSAHSSSEIAALYWGTDADSPRKTYGFYGPVPGRGHIAIVWPRSSGGTVQYGRIENIIIEGNQLHFELWNDWGRRPPYGPVIYDLTRVSPDALDGPSYSRYGTDGLFGLLKGPRPGLSTVRSTGCGMTTWVASCSDRRTGAPTGCGPGKRTRSS